MLFERTSKLSIPIEIHPRMAWIYWPPGPRDSPPRPLGTASCSGRCRPWSTQSVRYRIVSGLRARCAATGSDPVPFRQIAENCRRRGTVGVRGVSRMDAATKATWTYLRRPRTPTVPRHPTECPLLTLTLIRQVQGCKPCRPPHAQCSREATAARKPAWACPESGA
ncbi:hypothetical protein C1922_16220 [Stenotrophomonas sp. ZAC14D2_NAIMI4_7]|nr:hypothetical protein C1922_16220 [Stenotrophomonas sp. ZAC14D2_NAIMI4_7]